MSPETHHVPRVFHIPSIPLCLQVPHVPRVPSCPQGATMVPESPMPERSHVPMIPPYPQDLLSPQRPLCPQCLPRAPMLRVPPCTQGPSMTPCFPKTPHSWGPYVPRSTVPPVPGTCPHLGTPARGLPSDAPGTGSRCGPQSRAGTGTVPSPAVRAACSAGQLFWHQEGSRAVLACQGAGSLTALQAGCRECVGWHPQGSQPPAPPRLQKWGAQRSQVLPTTLGRQAQAPVLRSQAQAPAVQ